MAAFSQPDFGSVAKAAVKIAGTGIVRSRWKDSPVRAKASGDVVTRWDLHVDSQVSNHILESFPDHGIISEESGETNADAEYVWILDPIDGSRHFSQGLPLYSISLALRRRDDLILGVVYAPEGDRLFAAETGGGATLDEEPISCSQRTSLADSIVCVEIPTRHYPIELRSYALEKLALLMDHADRVRVIGVSALGLCYTAMGGFDAYVNLSGASKIWDLAAGKVILREAGGQFTRFADGPIVGGPPVLYDQLVDLLGLPGKPE